jgi:hypothetical protein
MHGGALSAACPALDWSRKAIGLAMAGIGGDHSAQAADKEAA